MVQLIMEMRTKNSSIKIYIEYMCCLRIGLGTLSTQVGIVKLNIQGKQTTLLNDTQM